MKTYEYAEFKLPDEVITKVENGKQIPFPDTPGLKETGVIDFVNEKAADGWIPVLHLQVFPYMVFFRESNSTNTTPVKKK